MCKTSWWSMVMGSNPYLYFFSKRRKKLMNYVPNLCILYTHKRSTVQISSSIRLCLVDFLKDVRYALLSQSVNLLHHFQDENADSAEVRIAKVAITNVTLWVCIWSPYAFVVMTAAFGDRSMITPMVSQLPSFLCKSASVINPFIFALR